jgi:hypothetical protein
MVEYMAAALAEEGGTQALKILPMKLGLDDFNKILLSILFSWDAHNHGVSSDP